MYNVYTYVYKYVCIYIYIYIYTYIMTPRGGGHSCRSGVSAPWPLWGSGWVSWGPNPPGGRLSGG